MTNLIIQAFDKKLLSSVIRLPYDTFNQQYLSLDPRIPVTLGYTIMRFDKILI